MGGPDQVEQGVLEVRIGDDHPRRHRATAEVGVLELDSDHTAALDHDAGNFGEEQDLPSVPLDRLGQPVGDHLAAAGRIVGSPEVAHEDSGVDQ